FPRREVRPHGETAALAAALGLAPGRVLEADHLMAVFDDETAVSALRPNQRLLEQLDAALVIATAPGRNSDYVCRVFAPKMGIAEDPVTGSAHCLLAPYWAERLGKTELFARHLSPRGGEVYCDLSDSGVRIAGHTVKYLQGELFL
ncbi:PhzF family phenazine biosynthesis protein, partial [Methylogaea oryzae]